MWLTVGAEGAVGSCAQAQQLLVGGVHQPVEELVRIFLLPLCIVLRQAGRDALRHGLLLGSCPCSARKLPESACYLTGEMLSFFMQAVSDSVLLRLLLLHYMYDATDTHQWQ